MQYLKSYKLFESLEITEWSDIKDLINVIEDEFNFEFKQLKVRDDSSYGGDKTVSFIFESGANEPYISPLYKKDEDIYRWFIKKIVDINKFTYVNNQHIEVIKLRDNFRVSSEIYGSTGQKISSIIFPDLTDVVIFRNGRKNIGSDIGPKLTLWTEYHFNFKVNVFTGLEWVIKNPQDKDLLKVVNPDTTIKNLFQYYCKRSFLDIGFDILSVFSDKPNKLITPVKKRDVQLPYNLSDQFIIDITPIFLEKVFKASGLIFRLQISTYDERGVTNSDRLRGHSIAQETDEKLKELGLDMTWEDIFIIEN